MTPHDDLKKLAMEATPGPWEIGTAGNATVVHFDGSDVRGVGLFWSRHNEAYVAAANPARILALIEENRVLRQVRRIPKTRNRKGWEGMTRDEEDEITDTNRLDWIALRPGIVKILKKGILVAGVNESQPNVRTAIDLAIRMEIKRNQRGSNNG